MSLWRRCAAAAIAAAGTLVLGGGAQALTLSFNQFAFPNGVNPIPGTPTVVSEQGFTFTACCDLSAKFEVFGAAEARFPGQVALILDGAGRTTTLTRDGGGTFSLASLDVANILSPGAVDIEIDGIVHGGSAVHEDFSFNSFDHLTTLTLDSDFQDLDSVSWAQVGNPEFQFTNVVVQPDATALPEPTMPAVLGLAGLGLLRRRKSA
jgi:MYXO-CTERM domain-containing protein